MRQTLKAVMVLGALGMAACRVGPNPARSPAATAPRGIGVQLFFDSGEEPVSGELLEVQDSGLLIQRPESIELFRYSAFRAARSQSGPRRTRIRTSDSEAFQTWTPFARHPYGISAEQLSELLRFAGQDELLIHGS